MAARGLNRTRDGGDITEWIFRIRRRAASFFGCIGFPCGCKVVVNEGKIIDLKLFILLELLKSTTYIANLFYKTNILNVDNHSPCTGAHITLN